MPVIYIGVVSRPELTFGEEVTPGKYVLNIDGTNGDIRIYELCIIDELFINNLTYTNL